MYLHFKIPKGVVASSDKCRDASCIDVSLMSVEGFRGGETSANWTRWIAYRDRICRRPKIMLVASPRLAAFLCYGIWKGATEDSATDSHGRWWAGRGFLAVGGAIYDLCTQIDLLSYLGLFCLTLLSTTSRDYVGVHRYAGKGLVGKLSLTVITCI